MSVSINGTNGLTFNDGSAQTTAATGFGFKNRIINGAFDVWQRGTSFTGNFTSQYGADRWSQGQFQTGPQSRQSISTAGIGFNYACRISSSSVASVSTGSRMALGQMVESVNCYDLKGTQVTLSFWARFSNATFTSSTATPFQNFGAVIWQYTTTTDASFATTAPNIVNVTYITNGSLPTTWTKYTYTITTSSSLNNIAVRFNFDGLGSTAADDTLWYEIAGVQLEKGSTATSFDYRPYGTELALCQRYYYRQTGQAAGDYFVPNAYAISTTLAFGYVAFPVPMRTRPTALEQSGTAADYNVVRCGLGTNANCSAVPTFGVANLTNAQTVFTVASGLSNGVAGSVQTNNTSAYLGWSAEL